MLDEIIVDLLPEADDKDYESYDENLQCAADLAGNAGYQKWLAKRIEVKFSTKPKKDRTCDYPQYAWAAKEADLEARREGSMLYQRGNLGYKLAGEALERLGRLK